MPTSAEQTQVPPASAPLTSPLDISLKGALQLRLSSADGSECLPWDFHHSTPGGGGGISVVSYTSSSDLDYGPGQSQTLGSLSSTHDKDSLLSLIRRSLLTPLLNAYEDEDKVQLAAYMESPRLDKLSLGMQCLFPMLVFQPGIVLQSECPIKFPQNETDFLINDNDSQLSGLDFAEMDASSNHMATASQSPPPDPTPTDPPLPTSAPSKSSPPPPVANTDSPNAVSPPSLQRETPSPLGETGQSDASEAKGSQVTRLAYCQRLADSAMSKLGISTNAADINQHILSLGSTGGLHALEKEKRRVKFILRKYDLTYEKTFGQAPSRAEKEPMRIVYVYYRKVKLAIDKLSSGNNDLPHQMQTTTESQATSQSSPNQAPLEELERKLEKMVAQKVVLAKRLQSYQEAFEKRNGRRIRYHRDIVEIDSDYRKYKKLRAHVLQLTEAIKVRRALLTARGEPTAGHAGISH